jgi:hypothetical protein
MVRFSNCNTKWQGGCRTRRSCRSEAWRRVSFTNSDGLPATSAGWAPLPATAEALADFGDIVPPAATENLPPRKKNKRHSILLASLDI